MGDQLLGGSAGVTLAYALTLASCLAAFNADLPLASTVAVDMAGVLAFRLLTLWLPILPGWLAYRALRVTGTL